MALQPDVLQATLKRVMAENGGVETLGLRFYARLFEHYPQVRPLFSTPPEIQHKKLIASIGAIVGSVTNLEKLVPYLHAMGIRHLAYKTENGHYAAVKENLLAVLEEHLSAEGEFTPEMKTAWDDAIEVVNQIMIEAADAPDTFADEIKANGYQADGFKANDPEPWQMSA